MANLGGQQALDTLCSCDDGPRRRRCDQEGGVDEVTASDVVRWMLVVWGYTRTRSQNCTGRRIGTNEYPNNITAVHCAFIPRVPEASSDPASTPLCEPSRFPPSSSFWSSTTLYSTLLSTRSCCRSDASWLSCGLRECGYNKGIYITL